VTFLDDMNDAALQANRDIVGFYQYLDQNSSSGPEVLPGIAPAVGMAAVGVAATIQSNMIAAAQLGVNIANTVLTHQSAGESLEITVTNNSTKALTLYNCRPTKADISNVPNPLFTGETDTVVLTRGDGFIQGTTSVELQFCIGNGEAIDSNDNSVILFSITYSYIAGDTDPGRWIVQATVDDSELHSFAKAIQMLGFTFESTPGSDCPGFSLYTFPIETSEGSISLVIYDR
jgi:hypothetical protein